jgi:hypothetical protein
LKIVSFSISHIPDIQIFFHTWYNKPFILRILQYLLMAKGKKKNSSCSPSWGILTPRGAVGRIATGDGRSPNPTKNLKRKWG